MTTTMVKSAILTEGQFAMLAEARAAGVLRSCEDSTFCFTGVMSVRRADLERLVAVLGGRAVSSVNNRLTVLVDSEASDPPMTAKATAAWTHNVPRISEQELVELLLPTPYELLRPQSAQRGFGVALSRAVAVAGAAGRLGF